MNSANNVWKFSPLRFNELALLLAIVVVVLTTMVFDSNHDYFHNPWDSTKEIARYTALLGIFALGSAVVIIAGGIDLSTGSTIAFSATVCGALMLIGADALVKPAQEQLAATTAEKQKAENLSKTEVRELPEVIAQENHLVRLWIAVTAFAMSGAIASGFLVGTLHAWLITSIRLPPFIATLATLVGLRSFARIICDGVTAPRNLVRTQINLNDPVFRYINEHVTVQVVVFVVLALVTWFILSKTLLGRHIYALGGNEQAARLSGIRTQNVKWFAYCFASVTASIAGILIMGSELVAAPVNQGRGYELNAIAAAVVGGCSLQGGVGTVQGTILGALFLRVVIDSVAKIIKSGADMYEGMIVGAVVVVAVTFSQLRQVWATGQQLFPGALGIFSIATISIFTWTFAASNIGLFWGTLVGLGMLAVLVLLKVIEVVRTER